MTIPLSGRPVFLVGVVGADAKLSPLAGASLFTLFGAVCGFRGTANLFFSALLIFFLTSIFRVRSSSAY